MVGVASTVVVVVAEDTKAEAAVTEEVEEGVDHTLPAVHTAVVVVAQVEQRNHGVVVAAVEAPPQAGPALAVILNERHIHLLVAHRNSYLNTKCI